VFEGAPYSSPMDEELTALEARLDQIIALCQSLRAENQTLRTRVAALEGERHRLTERMGEARERIETLMQRLPASAGAAE